MMNRLKVLMFTSLILFSGTLFAGNENVKLIVSQYLNQVANEQISQTIPKGKYFVKVNVELDSKKVSMLSSGGATFKLPFSQTLVTSSEIGEENDNSIAEYLDTIKKINVELAIPAMPAEIKDMLVKQLSTALYLDSSRGDSLRVSNNPAELEKLWKETNKSLNQTELVFTPSGLIKTFTSLEVSGFMIAIGAIIASLMVFLGIQFFGKRLSQNATELVKAVETMADSKPPMGAVAGAMGGSGGGSSIDGEVLKSMSSALGKGGQNEFFKNIDDKTLLMFCYDCIGSDSFGTVPVYLISELLDKEKGKAIEAYLPKKFYEDNITKAIIFNQTDVENLFKKNFINYKKCSKSQLAEVLMRMNNTELQTIYKTLKGKEVVIFINSLLPLRREKFINILDIDKKFEIAQLGMQGSSDSEMQTIEKKIFDVGVKIYNDAQSKLSNVNFKYLQDLLLTAQTFEEDEVFFKKAKEMKVNYQSVLSLLDILSDEDFKTMNLNHVATSFFGYSQATQDVVLSRFEGKQLEWLRHFMKQAEVLKLSFTSKEVQSIHTELRKKLPKIEEKTPAAPPELRKVA